MYKKGFSKQYVLFFPLNTTIPMPNENAVYHSFLDICSTCIRNSMMNVLPVAVKKLTLETNMAAGKKSEK